VIFSSTPIVLCILLIVWIYRHRSNKLIQLSGIEFLFVMLVGSILLYISIYFFIITMTAAICSVRLWLGVCGFSMVTGSHFARVYRLWRKYTDAFGRSQLSKRSLYLRVGAFFAFQFLLLLTFNIVAPPTVNSVIDSENPAITHLLCSYDYRFMWSTITYDLVMLLFCCFYCIILNKADTQFVGRVSVYSLLVVTVIEIVLFFVLDQTDDLSLWLFPLSVIFAVTLPVILFFVSYFIAVNEDTYQYPSHPRKEHTKNEKQDKNQKSKPKLESSKNQSLPPISTLTNKSQRELLNVIQQSYNQIAILQNKLLQKKNQLKSLKKHHTDDSDDDSKL